MNLADLSAAARLLLDKGVKELSDSDLKDLLRVAATELEAREKTARATAKSYPVQLDDAPKETTKPEKPHWKDVARPGEGLADFIKREFEPELAAGTMARPMLDRYRGLYKAFDNQLRRRPAEMPPELRKIPKKPDANDRLVATGKVTSVEVVRAARRDVKRIATARRRAAF